MSSISRRRYLRNGQMEPPYPEHETVVFSIRYPYHTTHRATDLCAIEGPHLIEDCGEMPQ